MSDNTMPAGQREFQDVPQRPEEKLSLKIIFGMVSMVVSPASLIAVYPLAAYGKPLLATLAATAAVAGTAHLSYLFSRIHSFLKSADKELQGTDSQTPPAPRPQT